MFMSERERVKGGERFRWGGFGLVLFVRTDSAKIKAGRLRDDSRYLVFDIWDFSDITGLLGGDGENILSSTV